MGTMPAAPATPADPRPRVVENRVDGTVCSDCGHIAARRHPRCERCLASTQATAFGPEGTVWSSTDVHFPVEGREAPFTLSYVDLDDGPRVLARLVHTGELAPGTRVRVVGDDHGDVLVDEVAPDEATS